MGCHPSRGAFVQTPKTRAPAARKLWMMHLGPFYGLSVRRVAPTDVEGLPQKWRADGVAGMSDDSKRRANEKCSRLFAFALLRCSPGEERGGKGMSGLSGGDMGRYSRGQK